MVGRLGRAGSARRGRLAVAPGRAGRPPRLRAGRELEAGLQRGARIQPGANAAGQPVPAPQPAGRSGPPLRPMNSVRSAVHAVCRPPRSTKATRPPNSVFHAFRASSAWVSGVELRAIEAAGPARVAQHPLGVGVTDSRRARPDRFSIVSTDTLTGSSPGRTARARGRCRVDVLEAAISRGLPGDVGRSLAADRQRRRSPQLAVSSSRR